MQSSLDLTARLLDPTDFESDMLREQVRSMPKPLRMRLRQNKGLLESMLLTKAQFQSRIDTLLQTVR